MPFGWWQERPLQAGLISGVVLVASLLYIERHLGRRITAALTAQRGHEQELWRPRTPDGLRAYPAAADAISKTSRDSFLAATLCD